MAKRTVHGCAGPGREKAAAFELPDGRRLAYAIYGKDDGVPLLALHGTPGSHLKFEIADRAADERGIRLICPDRWGYGGTDAHAAPSLSAFAADMITFLDALGIDRVGVLGVSGGGPFAVAVAAQLGARSTAAGLVAPVGPIAATGIGWRDLAPLHNFAFRVLPRIPGAVGGLFQPFRALTLARPEAGAWLATRRAAAADRAVMRGAAVRGAVGATFAEGLRPGVVGPAIDLSLFSGPWGVSPHAISCPVVIWIGTDDRNVPIVPVFRLARRIARADLKVIPGAGHFWIVENIPTVLDHLLENGLAESSASQGTAAEESEHVEGPRSENEAG